MAARIGDRLTAARRRWFVGRDSERELLRAALAAPDLPFSVLFVYGPGGVGKSALLAEYARLGAESGAGVYAIDARNVEPAPDAFVGAMRRSLDADGSTDPLDVLAERPGRHVVLVDTFETLTPLDAWLRDVFLPQLPENTLVVFAGRQPPSTAWRVDPGWQALIRIVPLRNLSPSESRQFLSQQDIPSGHHAGVLEFTHGHPLALSL
jgi:hypothetical protein